VDDPSNQGTGQAYCVSTCSFAFEWAASAPALRALSHYCEEFLDVPIDNIGIHLKQEGVDCILFYITAKLHPLLPRIATLDTRHYLNHNMVELLRVSLTESALTPRPLDW